MAINSFKGRELDKTKPVYVYRCLNRKGRVFSVKQNGKVVGHTENLILRDVDFIVGKSGKERAIREQQRNVHAYLKGMIVESELANNSNPSLVKYNPFNESGFYSEKEGTQANISWAKEVVINEKGVFAKFCTP